MVVVLIRANKVTLQPCCSWVWELLSSFIRRLCIIGHPAVLCKFHSTVVWRNWCLNKRLLKQHTCPAPECLVNKHSAADSAHISPGSRGDGPFLSPAPRLCCSASQYKQLCKNAFFCRSQDQRFGLFQLYDCASKIYYCCALVPW